MQDAAYAHELNMTTVNNNQRTKEQVLGYAANPNIDLNRVQRGLTMTNGGSTVQVRFANWLRSDTSYAGIGPATAIYVLTAENSWQKIDTQKDALVTVPGNALINGMVFRIGKPGGCLMSSNGLCIQTPETANYAPDANGCLGMIASDKVNQNGNDGLPLVTITYQLAKACMANGDPTAPAQTNVRAAR